MEKLKVNGYMIEVDYAEELEVYMDRLERVRIRGEKVQACSPFRQEKNPSFAVNLDNGSWVDSGADSESERKGSFIHLLAHFRGESYEDTAEYLLDKYTHILDDADSLSLNLNLQLEEPEVAVLNQDKYIDEINKKSKYLLNRGISYNTQHYFQTGVGGGQEFILIPWHNIKGEIVNIKYRSVTGKKFWFASGGQPIKNYVYGLFAIKNFGSKEVWAVESEIDALYLWSNGIPAIAFGGASINDVQKKLILKSGIETLVIATDNDVVGQRFGRVLFEELGGYLNIKLIKIPEGKKDVNDLTKEELFDCKKKMIPFNILVKI